MALPAASIIAAGANIIGGLLGSSSQDKANKTNLQIAREQMDFQREMSSTAYQRAADDMEAAGLNRILAANNPASTPYGAAIPVSATTTGDFVGESANTALSAAKTNADTDTAKKLLDNMQSQQKLNDEKAKTEQKNRSVLDAQRALYQAKSDEASANVVYTKAKASEAMSNKTFTDEKGRRERTEGLFWQDLGHLYKKFRTAAEKNKWFEFKPKNK